MFSLVLGISFLGLVLGIIFFVTAYEFLKVVAEIMFTSQLNSFYSWYHDKMMDAMDIIMIGLY